MVGGGGGEGKTKISHLHHCAIRESQEMAVEVAQAVQVEGVDGDVGGDLLAQSLLHTLSLMLADLPSVSRVPHVLVQL